MIRAGVVYNRTQYFIDRGVSSAASATSPSSCWRRRLNKRLKTGLLKVYVAIVPLARDQLFPALQDGKVDLVAAALTITPDRRKDRRLQHADPHRRVGDCRDRADRGAACRPRTICRAVKSSSGGAAATTRA